MSEWKPIQPDDLVHITVKEFESGYVSRQSYDALRAQVSALTEERDHLAEVAKRDGLQAIAQYQRAQLAEADMAFVNACGFVILHEDDGRPYLKGHDCEYYVSRSAPDKAA